MYTLFYKALILQGEIWYWSLLRLKGLRVLFQAGLSLTVGSRWYPSAVISEYNCQVLLQKKKERKQDQKNFQAVHFAASYLPGNFIKILVIALLKGVQVAEHSCIQSFMLPWKLRKIKFYLSLKIFHQYIFPLPSFSLWAGTFLLPWFGKWNTLTNCQNCVQPPYSTRTHKTANLILSTKIERRSRYVTLPW